MIDDNLRQKIYTDMKACLCQIIDDKEFAAQFLEKTSIVELKRKTILYKSGTVQDSLYILYTGMVWTFNIVNKKSAKTPEKKLTDAMYYNMGDLIRLDYSFDTFESRGDTTYQAVQDSILLKISIDDWNELFKHNNYLLIYYTQALMNDLNWHKQLREMRYLKIMERYNWLKNNYPDLCTLKKCYMLPLLDISSSSYKNMNRNLRQKKL